MTNATTTSPQYKPRGGSHPALQPNATAGNESTTLRPPVDSWERYEFRRAAGELKAKIQDRLTAGGWDDLDRAVVLRVLDRLEAVTT